MIMKNTLEQDLKQVKIMQDVYDLIKEEDWASAEMFVGDVMSELQIKFKKLMNETKLSSLPPFTPRELKNEDDEFSKKFNEIVGKSFEAMQDLTGDEAYMFLDTLRMVIGKAKAKKLGEVTLESLEPKLLTEEDITKKHEASQTENS